jgi:hypothetical protein
MDQNPQLVKKKYVKNNAKVEANTLIYRSFPLQAFLEKLNDLDVRRCYSA